MQKVTNGKQLKAARAALGLTMGEMAKLANIHFNSVQNAERPRTIPKGAYAAGQIETALRAQGVEFITVDGKTGVLFPAKQKPAQGEQAQ